MKLLLLLPPLLAVSPLSAQTRTGTPAELAAEPVPPPNVALVNATAAGVLTNVATFSTTHHSGGLAWVDCNNDSWPDLVLTNGSGRDNILYRNDGDGTFTEIVGALAKPNLALECAGIEFADVENDGDSDILIVVDSPVSIGTSLGGPNLFYLNRRDCTFVDQAGPALKQHAALGGSIGDDDGDVDFAIWNDATPSALMRNDFGDPNHRLSIKLSGTQSNRDAIGAVVDVTAGGLMQLRRVSGGDSAHSQQELILHFGLDLRCARASRIEVRWPSGVVQEFLEVAADDLLFIVVGHGELAWDPSSLSFVGSFPGMLTSPATATLISTRGSVFVVPVTDVPQAIPRGGRPRAARANAARTLRLVVRSSKPGRWG